MGERTLEPEEIRAIRESLGLTQEEAGRVLGGGPRAFGKYESGSVKPSSAFVGLLRVLAANPGMIATLQGSTSRAAPTAIPLPVQVTSKHIAALTEREVHELLRLLLSAEVLTYELPRAVIRVASNIHAVDGGEDGRIEWEGGPAHTLFLPSRLCQFQVKSGEVSPAKAGRDILTKAGEIKEMVRSALEHGGNYIMLCAHPYVGKSIQNRETKIRDALRDSGLAIADRQIEFRDADQIASWINQHPAVAMWLLDKVQPGLRGPFHAWQHWADRAAHRNSPWVDDDRLPRLSTLLRERVAEPRTATRLVGLSGVGKSRLALEALRATREEVALGPALSDLVLYADASESGTEAVNAAVQSLADSGRRAIAVVDSCPPETHRVLAGMVSSHNSHVALVTIHDEIPAGPLDQATFKVPEAPASVTESIIDRSLPALRSEDRHRLTRFSRGFPQIAIRTTQLWAESAPLAQVLDDDLVDAFVVGHNPRARDLLLQSAALLASFRLVGVDHPLDSQLTQIASLGDGLTADGLYTAIRELEERGVVQRRGRYASVEPRPIALKLAERQWQRWRRDKWDEVLAGDGDLKVLAARQLALLNTTNIARGVAQHVCRFDGPFAGPEGLSAPGHAEVLSFLAEIDAQIVADQIRRSLNELGGLWDPRADAHYYVTRALETVAFAPQTFEDGAHLLLRLASAEDEMGGHSATEGFQALFPVLLGNTAASGDERLGFLDEAADTEDPIRHKVVVGALGAGLEMDYFSRSSGPETHGSRPALVPWHPASHSEMCAYVEGCVIRLARFAARDDEAGAQARARLGRELDSLIRHGLIDTVETVVGQVGAASDYWPEALTSLKRVIRQNPEETDLETTARVEQLVAGLQPATLEARVRLMLAQPLWDHLAEDEADLETQRQGQVETARELAAELLTRPEDIGVVLALLSRAQQGGVYDMGKAIAELADSPEDWLEPIAAATADTPEGECNFSLLAGYIAGIAADQPAVVDEFKAHAAQSSKLAPSLPRICLHLDIAPSDIALVLTAIQAELLPPGHLLEWSAALPKLPAKAVAPLLDTILDHSAEGFTTALRLIAGYFHNAPEQLESLLPQMRKVAVNSTRWEWGDVTDVYHFEQIVEWMLNKGRQDGGANATALTLTRVLVSAESYGATRPLKPVIHQLLSEFPEIAWPLIGEAIVSADQRRVWLLETILKDPRIRRRRRRELDPPILSLPVDTLFAWCHAHPERAPAFAARIVPALATDLADSADRSLHPVMLRILDEFGDREDVQHAVTSNIQTGGWVGPEADHWELYKEALTKLQEHPRPKVRRWVQTTLRELEAMAEGARSRDAELDALWGD